ncbi:hypothetical protein [Sciscionella marina]|uniref:hypothetical protein n=1 Tax=Sciscionella marina TaxID=508770 RepID=UPI000362F1B2|nr:hypothetical protein [Sciscionella marina]
MPSTYEHLIVRDMQDCLADFANEGDAAGLPTPDNLGEGLALMRSADVPESRIHMSHMWIKERDTPIQWVIEHEHPYDEVLIWTGNNPDDPRDLGAELYFDIEGERHIITTSGSVYIPAGVRHCPLGFNRVDRPFRFSALSLNPSYESDEGASRP